MVREARRRGIDLGALIERSATLTPEPCLALVFFGGAAEHHSTDWVWMGYLLRHELSWEDTYADFPGAWDGLPH
jgi:hypothetical protein